MKNEGFILIEPGGWRKFDFLRGRPNCIVFLLFLSPARLLFLFFLEAVEMNKSLIVSF